MSIKTPRTRSIKREYAIAILLRTFMIII